MTADAEATATYDREKRCLRLVFSGEVDGAAYRACMEGWLRDQPEAAAADWLYDLRDYRGSITHGDVTAFARVYDAAVGTRDAGALSVFVTPDPGFRFWVQACARTYVRRRLIVVNTMEEAEAMLHGAAAATRG